VFKSLSDLWPAGVFCFCFLADPLASSSHNIDGYDKIDILSEAAFPGFSGVRVARSWVFCVVFCGLTFVIFFYFFYFGHCVVCPSLIYGIWLPLWYLQTLLTKYIDLFIFLVLLIFVFQYYEKKDLGQTSIHKTLHRKLKIEQHEPH
jgi:hypothetical protein